MGKIKVIIKKDGTLEVSVNGIKGKKCKDVTKFIEGLGDIESTKNTSEYHEAPEQERDKERN